MANSDVTSSSAPPEPSDESRPTPPPAPRRRLPAFLVFGIVAATVEMGIVLALLYC